MILSGGLDLSVPWTIGFCGILAAGLIQGSNVATLWAVPLALGVGALIGLVNGLGVASLGLPPIVVTLAMNGVLQGAALLYSNGTPAGFASPALRWLMTGAVAGITPVVGLMAVFILFGVTLLGRTVFGRWVYAVGNSPRASFLSGVGVKATTIGVYVLSGFCAALVGVLITGFSGQASLGMGDDFLLPSIAVVIVGGTLITGGRGTYIGMLGGVLLLTALQTLAFRNDAAARRPRHHLRRGRPRLGPGPAGKVTKVGRDDMWRDLTEEQIAIREMAETFACEKMAPFAGEWDATKTLPVETLREAAALGLGGVTVGERFGGSGLTRLDSTLIFEALATGCPSVAAFLSIHNMAVWMIDAFASDDFRAEVVPRLVTMEQLASYCLTEPGAGSDAGALSTRARREGDAYVIDGAKQFISGAGASDWYVTMTRTGAQGSGGVTAIAVPASAPGLSFGANEKKMGWNAQPTRQVLFENCRVPVANRLGSEGEGFRIAMKGLDGGRLNIAACSLAGRRPRSTGRWPTWRKEKPLEGRSISFKRCSSASRTWRPNSRPRGRCCTRRPAAWTRATPTRRSLSRWRSASPPTPVSRLRMRRRNSTAATAISRIAGSRRSCATFASTAFSKAPMRSCA